MIFQGSDNGSRICDESACHRHKPDNLYSNGFPILLTQKSRNQLATGKASLLIPCHSECYGSLLDDGLLMAPALADLRQASAVIQARASNGLRYPIPHAVSSPMRGPR